MQRLIPTLLLLVLVGACAGDAAEQARAEVGPTDRCADLELPPVQAGAHLIGDTDPPVPYSSTPPTSGWHASGAPPLGTFDDGLAEAAQVLALEAGAVVVTWRGLDAAEREALDDVVSRAPVQGRVTVTPYDQLGEGEVVLATWGALQRCDGVDVDAIENFVEAFAVPDPAAHDEA